MFTPKTKNPIKIFLYLYFTGLIFLKYFFFNKIYNTVETKFKYILLNRKQIILFRYSMNLLSKNSHLREIKKKDTLANG